MKSGFHFLKCNIIMQMTKACPAFEAIIAGNCFKTKRKPSVSVSDKVFSVQLYCVSISQKIHFPDLFILIPIIRCSSLCEYHRECSPMIPFACKYVQKSILSQRFSEILFCLKKKDFCRAFWCDYWRVDPRLSLDWKSED